MPDVLEQLRCYGEAVEQEALNAGHRGPVVGQAPWRRRPQVLLVAAAIVAVVALGGVALRLALADAKVKVVATTPRSPAIRSTTPPTINGATTTEAEPATTTSEPPSSTTTSSVVRRPSGVAAPVTPTPSAATATTSTPTSIGTTNSTAPTTTTTPSSSPRFAVVRGTATWTGGRDPRAALQVGACPVGDIASGCGGWRVTEVGPDGSFELSLPTADAPRDWNIVALVSHGSYSCAFNCTWRTSQVGPSTTISDAAPPSTLALAVSARVIDVFVRDRNNQPFQGGGVMVSDSRCPKLPCPYDLSPMYSQASSTDGAARITVDPSLTYELTGMVSNTGWPNPQTTYSDGTTWWFSATFEEKGSAIPEGRTFLVNGAAA